MPNIQALFSNIYLLGFFSALFTFILANRMFPVIIYTVRAKNLMDEPENRSAHSSKIPTLGGVGMFAAFSLSLILFGILLGLKQPDLLKLLALIGSTLILLFLGMKDDLISIAPKKKLMGQLIATGLVIFSTDLRILSFYDLLGIGELPYIVSVLFTFFVFILVINAFNLIDGIDGLAGSIAIIGSSSFGLFFLLNDNYLMALVSFILIGATLGFLRYNLSDNRKVFMGDSGSMFIGFLLAFQGVAFLEINSIGNMPVPVSNAPILLLAFLSFPLLDTLRVFVIRAREKRSPFSPDSNHIHHRLLNLGLTHKQATLLIIIGNVFIIELAFLLNDLYINVHLFIVVGVGSIVYLAPFLKVFEKGVPVTDEKSITEEVEEGNLKLAGESYELVPKTSQPYKTPVELVAFNDANATMKGMVVEESNKAAKNPRMGKMMAKRKTIFKKKELQSKLGQQLPDSKE